MADQVSSSVERLRLFVAIEVPATVRTEMAKAQHCLRQTVAETSARWTRPEQFHLTLRFLGSVDAASTEPLLDSLGAACQSIPAFQLRSSRIGFFPNRKAPRVVWAGVQDNENQLLKLHATVEEATSSFTAEKAEERFTGHITFGRLKGLHRSEVNVLTKAAENLSATSFGEWTAREIHLIRSDISSRGAEHISLATIFLGSSLA